MKEENTSNILHFFSRQIMKTKCTFDLCTTKATMTRQFGLFVFYGGYNSENLFLSKLFFLKLYNFTLNVILYSLKKDKIEIFVKNIVFKKVREQQ